MLKLNLNDILAVLQTCVPHLIALAVILVVLLAVMVAVRKLPQAKKRMIRGTSGVAMVLALVIVLNTICVGPLSTLLDLVSGHGTITEASAAEANELCVNLAEEGIVLLQNDDSMLPLASGSNVNVFGWGSVDPVYGGTGSGALSDDVEKVDLLQGLANAGLNTNEALSQFYRDYCAKRPELGYAAHNWTLPEPPASTYSQELLEDAKAFSDTAIVVLSRIGGEFADLPTDMAVTRSSEVENYTDNSTEYLDFPDGTHYLEPSQSEKDMIDLVCQNFDNVILVYNGANTMELSIADQYSQIKGVIWCPGPGQTGFNALGEIIAGQVNPSGKATDTFVYDLAATPYFNNIGNFVYQNAEDYSFEGAGLFGSGATIPHFVNYVEGIYVGYRFYETAAEEGLIDYDQTVQYSFGSGLSYTTFEQSMGELTVADDTVSFDVTVTNTGSVAGKDVVEIFFNPPYTNGGIEKSSVNLVQFGKTGLLQPGESQTLSFSIPLEDMASYDYQNHGCYVLEAGSYGISIRNGSHTVLDEQELTVSADIVYDESNPRSSDQQAAVNAFDFAEGNVTYLSRADHFANYEEAVAAPTDFNLPDEAKNGLFNSYNWDPNDYNNPDDVMPTTGASNGLVLADLRGKDYDDPMWDDLLDQMTVAEMDDLIALGGYQTKAVSSIGKVATVDCDGPANITNNFTGLASIGFPSECIIASTWNVGLAEQFGVSIGKMADEMGVSGWYAPAMNTHRSAFDGRNFEYYSEDGVLAGYIGAAAIRGAQSQGVYAYMKHFALNDQQIGQNEMLCTWSNEQAIREIYLKPFELSAKVGETAAVMSSWNYIGNQWAGACSSLLQTVLRGEWGFRGMVITDGYHFTGYMDSDRAIRNGSDLMLKNFDVETNHVTDQSSATGVLAMRNSCHNILYTVVNSRAYDAANADTSMPTWQVVMIIVDVAAAIVLIGWEVLILRSYKKRTASAV
ncbi:glycoside hydrolase family 3 C-terminal domain-containing protein [Pseudoflavonifractor sp.]|jgi:beta-glucosidase|uniref:glycoside hydrolase family 3 protein n=1 Tax=Pseudoflavonifractor sp. TaxID=1980281 RepID=UPI003D8F0BB1